MNLTKRSPVLCKAAVVLILAGCGASASPSPATPVSPTDFAFVSSESGREEVWIWTKGDGEPTQFTTTGGTSPAWSADGQWLAFVAEIGGVPQVWITSYPTIGRQPVQVTRSGGEFPKWGPAGDRIHFIEPSSSGRRVMSIARDGTDIRQEAGAGGSINNVSFGIRAGVSPFGWEGKEAARAYLRTSSTPPAITLVFDDLSIVSQRAYVPLGHPDPKASGGIAFSRHWAAAHQDRLPESYRRYLAYPCGQTQADVDLCYMTVEQNESTLEPDYHGVLVATEGVDTDPSWVDGVGLLFASDVDSASFEIFYWDGASGELLRLSSHGGRQPAWRPRN